MALTADGLVYEWGEMETNPVSYLATPKLVSGISNVVFITAAYHRRVALKADGTVWEWRLAGQQAQPVPTQVVGLSGIVQLSTSWYHQTALDGDGRMYSWGENGSGELGNGSDQGSVVPIAVPFPESKPIVFISSAFSTTWLLVTM